MWVNIIFVILFHLNNIPMCSSGIMYIDEDEYLKIKVMRNKITKFDLLTFKDTKVPKGISAIVEFPNGWGASIIQNDVSYGGKSGLFEIAVLDSKGDINSQTDITDDVCGWCDEKDVDRILSAISKLDSDGVLPKGITT